MLITILHDLMQLCDLTRYMEDTEIPKKSGVNQECNRRKALRVIPRGKQRLTVYRAHQVPVTPCLRGLELDVGVM